jgi:hypothetical protein
VNTMPGAQRDDVRRSRRMRRPRTVRGWSVLILTTAAVVALKLTVGVALVLAVWHLMS